MYNLYLFAMPARPLSTLLCAAALIAAAPVFAQGDKDIISTGRVFTDVGPGVRGIARDAAGHYYILTSPAPAVGIYNAAGQRTGQVPAVVSGSSADKMAVLGFGMAVAVDPAGRLYVADRSDNAVKIFRPDGGLMRFVPIQAPTSVTYVGQDEFAVGTTRSPRLVTVFNLQGKVVREFGAPVEIAERADLNRYLNTGHLAADPDTNIYYAFEFLPEPTVRKSDRYGYAIYETALDSLDFYPMAQAARREIKKQETGGTPVMKPTVTAVAVDPVTQEVWMAVGGLLIHLDRDGYPHGIYRTYTAEGARVETIAILIEPERLLLASDPLGIYAFARPDRVKP
jgi:DNA-binding beta-propeller fold protein YncE